MRVILLDKVSNLGAFGDTVNVRSGYARNFLIPKGKAVVATEVNVKMFKIRSDKLKAKVTEQLSLAKARAEKVNNLSNVVISSKAGDEGKLFGSVGARNIANAISSMGVEVEKSEICLPDGVIRSTGEFDISLQFHPEVVVSIRLHVVSA
ncbi:50S ribosomal protein L9 [Candidatus Photodesmus katoptron]|uniref:Large ribosomal subunit protein bL9 n=1 Tax=Candidatus Photodesmus katoptron Akat1 TaxID=1236703 RepID=S3EIH7_9GAMM|nr:50S ribosomal protein L9 [Candidatus Photodesmus katoptron]EPE37988.1 ribosomal protein L9 [Candidatus Photodesmus katoptron Akat1]KEY90226.1 50S ribosomal protein L9 [Candidatus Photodesmus katoptron]